jgi:hypothetical protein
MDPHGFQIVRAKLEEIFPILSDVSTSSVGATVGSYLADFYVTPAQITKAFLASYGMTKDGLGARVVESRHTGRWRPACFEMFKMFDNRYVASAGSASQANHASGGNPHYNDDAYQSPYDRNLFLYAMLEIKLSLDKDSLKDDPYSTLSLYESICSTGVGGYRVPTSLRGVDSPTYHFRPGYEIHKFSPIVNYGSLESIRSGYMESLTDCSRDFAPEDLARHAYCGMTAQNNQGQTFLKLDNEHRKGLSPFLMQRDRLCNPKMTRISIEDTLATPRPFADGDELYDTPINDPSAVDSWVVPAWARGNEHITRRTLELSMLAYVYVTSSSDPSVRPGMHRLLDIPVFGDVGCAKLPNIDCADPGSSFFLNSGPSSMDAHENTVTYTSGRVLMRRVRCSQTLNDYFDQDYCDKKPYSGYTNCYSGDLELLSNPQFESSRKWLFNLIDLPPSPPPFSPSPPPPKHHPPFPPIPSTPPYIIKQKELMISIRKAEEQACTSVYYLTTATRCERLAVSLARSVMYEVLSPPSPPPADPLLWPPPPPYLPPSPFVPNGIVYSPVASARLSTVRIPVVKELIQTALYLYDDGYYTTEDNLKQIKEALVDAEQTTIARCTFWQRDAPLPCVTSALPENCISGTRHCDTEYKNLMEPTIDILLSGAPISRGNRLWGLEIELPQNDELASLLFKSASSLGGSGYRVDIQESDGSPVACRSQDTQEDAMGVTLDRRVQHVCARGDASDAEMYKLSKVTRIRITLIGSYRQLWIKRINILEITLSSAKLSPQSPHPPPRPDFPPIPPSRPQTTCLFEIHQFFTERTVVFKEPCGLTMQQCCEHAFLTNAQAEVDAFEIDDAGCCLLIKINGSPKKNNNERWGFLSNRAGTGTLV